MSQDDKTQTSIVLSQGTMVAHYRIVEKIGAGGMGEVYLAEDTELGRRVALKFIPAQFAKDDEHKARFKREAQAAAKLSHPNIVTVYEVREFNGRPFMVMEHVEGRSLHDFCHKEPLSVIKIIDLAVQISEGLSKAHKAGIIHRDVKSSNIVVDSDGRPKILDFGLATFKGSQEVTKVGSTLGTVSYMSPEQAQGEKIDHRSDLFSFGIVLYELLAGRTPFKRDSDAATLKAIVHDTAEPVTRYRAEVPEELQRIINKLLQRDLSLRYQNADDITADLKLLAISGSSPSVRAYQKKSKGKLVALGISAIAVLAIIAYFIYRGDQQLATASSTPMLVVLPFENLGSSEDQYFADGITDEITSRLSSMQNLGVISRTSAIQYRDAKKTIKEIGKELNVDYVLEGTIRWDKTGDTDRIRITPQLIQVATDKHLWSENYEETLTKIFAVQSDIAARIAEALNVTLSGSQEKSIAAQPTQNVAAHDLFLRGKQLLDEAKDQKDFPLALQLFENAVKLDSTFYSAQYQLARIYSNKYFNYLAGPEILDKARIAADKAYKFAKGAPEGYLAKGYYYYYGSRDYEGALKMFDSALALQPNNSDVLFAISYVQRRQGKLEESAKNQLHGLELDPNATNHMLETTQTLFLLRRYDDLAKILERAHLLFPDNPVFYATMIDLTISQTGTLDEIPKIIEEAGKVLDKSGKYYQDLQRQYEFLKRDWGEMLKKDTMLVNGTTKDSAQSYLNASYDCFRLDNPILQKAYADSAMVLLKKDTLNLKNPGPDLYINLAAAYALLGQKKEARLQLEKALQIAPVSVDYFTGILTIFGATWSYILIGDNDRVFDNLNYLLSHPSYYDANSVRLDPEFDPVRDDPRFEALLEKYDT